MSNEIINPFVLIQNNGHGLTQGFRTDAGFDLAVKGDQIVQGGRCAHPWNPARVLLPTGVAICMEEGTAARIVARSSTWDRHHLIVYEGLIDPGYQGELLIGVLNFGTSPVHIKDGERIAQVVFFPVITPAFVHVGSFPETERGTRGFGSTG